MEVEGRAWTDDRPRQLPMECQIQVMVETQTNDETLVEYCLMCVVLW